MLLTIGNGKHSKISNVFCTLKTSYISRKVGASPQGAKDEIKRFVLQSYIDIISIEMWDTRFCWKTTASSLAIGYTAGC